MNIERPLASSLVVVLCALAASSLFGCSDERGAGGAGGGGPDGAPDGGECIEASDCTAHGDADFCGEPDCIEGACVRKALQPEGTPLPSQKYGDCLEQRCGGSGEIVAVADDEDVYDDGNMCTEDLCTGGVPSHPVQPQGYLCGGICDTQGACVECIEGVQGCFDASETCIAGVCAVASCANEAKDPGEGDVDCGGNCAPCADGKSCTNEAQCASGVCTDGACAAPTCTDGVQNGDETGEDCGGPDCEPCGPDQPCGLPSDCASGVCIHSWCAAPTCTDAVQNGEEDGIDCGGGCDDACP